jgi:hypothetical protein
MQRARHHRPTCSRHRAPPHPITDTTFRDITETDLGRAAIPRQLDRSELQTGHSAGSGNAPAYAGVTAAARQPYLAGAADRPYEHRQTAHCLYGRSPIHVAADRPSSECDLL